MRWYSMNTNTHSWTTRTRASLNTRMLSLSQHACSGLQALQYGPRSTLQSGHHARVGLDAQEEHLQGRVGEEMAQQV